MRLRTYGLLIAAFFVSSSGAAQQQDVRIDRAAVRGLHASLLPFDTADAAEPRTLSLDLVPASLELEPRTLDLDPGPQSAAEPAPQTPRPPSYPKLVLLDLGYVLTSPFHWSGRQWLLFSGYVGSLAALSRADLNLSDAARERGTTFGFVGDTLEGLGDGRSFILLGGFYLAGAIGHDSKAKNVCLDGLAASLIASGLITPVLTTVVGRERPTEEHGAYSFKPFGGRSFPSGHVTQVFAVVSVIATSYDQLWVKAVAYTAGAFGAYARLQRGKHFPTDIVAGAIIGTAVGRSVVHLNRKIRSGEFEKATAPEGARLTLLPLVDDGAYGIRGTLAF
ncbi:MAG: phosphatase PAP2 family protein [Thermoanaerobaculia bacterium]